MNPTKNRMSEQAVEATKDSIATTKSAIAERPWASATTAFGLGLGAGLAIFAVMCQSRRRETVATRIGNQVMDALRSVSPDRFYS